MHFTSFAHVWSPLADHYGVAFVLCAPATARSEQSPLPLRPCHPCPWPQLLLGIHIWGNKSSSDAYLWCPWVFRFCWHCWRALCSSGLGPDLQSPKSPKPERSIVERASSMECSADPGRIGGEMCNHLSCEFCSGFTCRPCADWILDRIGISFSLFFAFLFCLCGFLAFGFGCFWLLILLPFVVSSQYAATIVQTKRKTSTRKSKGTTTLFYKWKTLTFRQHFVAIALSWLSHACMFLQLMYRGVNHSTGKHT